MLEICKKVGYLNSSSVFLAGSGVGSITALRTAADPSVKSEIDGCIVVSVISDLPEFIKARGDGVKNLLEGTIGGSFEAMPEEYNKRSAVTFTDNIDAPMLVISFEKNPPSPTSQALSLFD